MSTELETLKRLRSFQFVSSENLVGLSKGDYDETYYIKKQREYLDKYYVSAKEFEKLENALQVQDKVTTDKALECLEWVASSLLGKYNLFYLNETLNEKEWKESVDCIKDDYTTIKQALVKNNRDTIIANFIRKYFKVSKGLGDYLQLKNVLVPKDCEEFENALESDNGEE